jgi:hypothetical protein
MSEMMKENSVVELYVRKKFAEFTGLDERQLFAVDATLATVLAQSPKMTNSIDLMESFARTSNAIRKEFGVRVQLPTVPLDTSTSDVLRIFLAEFERQQEGVSA